MDDETAGAQAYGFARLFTVEEANTLLPTLIPLLTELKHDKEELDAARDELDRLIPSMRANGHGVAAAAIEQRIATLIERLTGGVRRITAMSIDVKDLNQGLIDFPHQRAGRIVFLCWHLGEGPITFWHEIADGFAGRQPL
ncbi:MAG: DUF2203 domain-containing protein [Thermomicrobiales bacterium]